MKEWKKAFAVLLATAALAVASHRALSRRPIDLLIVRAEGVEAEACRVRLFLNGASSLVDPLRLDGSQRKRAVRAVAERDREALAGLARELGGFRFAAGLPGPSGTWPGWLGGGPDPGSFGNLGLLDRIYFSLAAGNMPPPHFAEDVADVTLPGTGDTDGMSVVAPEPEPTPGSGATPTIAVAAAVKMEILNDCGIKGAADGIALAVKRPGVDILQVGNTKRFRYRRTHFQSSVGVPVVLQEILEEMGIPESEVQEIPPGRRAADVVLVVGRDYRKILERMRDRTRH